ncbi:hypothetical protein [Streptomyces sp. NPDC020742]|uniref:hypothetical protein n=1 Tax=Streptomyces sp. NPDC020742 TaxID=3154897 RepID=UPI0033C6DCB5
MTSRVIAEDRPHIKDLQRDFRHTRMLVGCYAGLSVLTLIALVSLRDHPDLATDSAWVRVPLVVVTSLMMMSFAARASHGRRRSFLRLRLASGIMVLAIAVIVALPGAFPVWLRIEQAVCGILLLGVVARVNGRAMRAAFAK